MEIHKHISKDVSVVNPLSLRGSESVAFRFGMELSYIEKCCSVTVVEL